MVSATGESSSGSSHSHPSPTMVDPSYHLYETQMAVRDLFTELNVEFQLRGLLGADKSRVMDVFCPEVRRSPTTHGPEIKHLDVVSCWRGLSFPQAGEIAYWENNFILSLDKMIKDAIMQVFVDWVSAHKESKPISKSSMIPTLIEFLSGQNEPHLFPIAVPDLVADMIERFYDNCANATHKWFTSTRDLPSMVFNFIRTRDAFLDSSPYPSVEICFSHALNDYGLCVFGDVNWHPPVIAFYNLPASLPVGAEYQIACKYFEPYLSGSFTPFPAEPEFTVSSIDMPLAWDSNQRCFRAKVRADKAAMTHQETLDRDRGRAPVKTLETSFEAHIVMKFPGDVRFEMKTRYALMLEVHPRAPNNSVSRSPLRDVTVDHVPVPIEIDAHSDDAQSPRPGTEPPETPGFQGSWMEWWERKRSEKKGCEKEGCDIEGCDLRPLHSPESSSDAPSNYPTTSSVDRRTEAQSHWHDRRNTRRSPGTLHLRGSNWKDTVNPIVGEEPEPQRRGFGESPVPYEDYQYHDTDPRYTRRASSLARSLDAILNHDPRPKYDLSRLSPLWARDSLPTPESLTASSPVDGANETKPTTYRDRSTSPLATSQHLKIDTQAESARARSDRKAIVELLLNKLHEYEHQGKASNKRTASTEISVHRFESPSFEEPPRATNVEMATKRLKLDDTTDMDISPLDIYETVHSEKRNGPVPAGQREHFRQSYLAILAGNSRGVPTTRDEQVTDTLQVPPYAYPVSEKHTHLTAGPTLAKETCADSTSWMRWTRLLNQKPLSHEDCCLDQKRREKLNDDDVSSEYVVLSAHLGTFHPAPHPLGTWAEYWEPKRYDSAPDSMGIWEWWETKRCKREECVRKGCDRKGCAKEGCDFKQQISGKKKEQERKATELPSDAQIRPIFFHEFVGKGLNFDGDFDANRDEEDKEIAMAQIRSNYDEFMEKGLNIDGNRDEEDEEIAKAFLEESGSGSDGWGVSSDVGGAEDEDEDGDEDEDDDGDEL